MTTYVRHAHSSGLHEKPPSAVADEVKFFVNDTENDWNVLTFTEVGEPERAEKLKANGWSTYAPHSAMDCAFMWLNAKWVKVFAEVHELTGCTYKDANGNIRHTKCATLVLDRTDANLRLLAMTAHLPSNVQNGCEFNKKEQPDKVECWKKAVDGWANYVQNGIRKKYDPEIVMLVADWNVDFFKQCWRDQIKNRFPNFYLNWVDEMPNDGTLGSRLIDATWSNKKSVAKLLKDNPSSDHRPYGEKIAF